MSILVKWSLVSGVNDSHLYEASWFYRLRDAKQAAADLPMAPDGKPRSYRIRRVEYVSVSRLWDRMVSECVVDERMRGPA